MEEIKAELEKVLGMKLAVTRQTPSSASFDLLTPTGIVIGRIDVGRYLDEPQWHLGGTSSLFPHDFETLYQIEVG